MKCCGSSGPQDYALSNWHNATRRRLCAGGNHGNVDDIGNHGNHGCPLDMPTIPASCCADQVDYLQCQIYYAQSRSNPNFITDSFHSEVSQLHLILLASCLLFGWVLTRDHTFSTFYCVGLLLCVDVISQCGQVVSDWSIRRHSSSTG